MEIPFWYKSNKEHGFGRKTILVLLQQRFWKYYFCITATKNTVLKVIPFWYYPQKHCFESNTILALLSEALF